MSAGSIHVALAVPAQAPLLCRVCKAPISDFERDHLDRLCDRCDPPLLMPERCPWDEWRPARDIA